MTISYVGHTTTTTSAGGSSTVNLPAGIQNGDYMIVILSCGNATSVTPPAGWGSLGALAGAWNINVYGRVASSEPASYSWTTTAAMNTVCAAWRSTNGSMSLDAAGGVAGFTNVTQATASAITQTAASAVHVFLGSYDTTNGTQNTWVPPAGYTNRLDFKGTVRPDIGVFDKMSSTTGTTGVQTASWTGLANNAGALLVSLAEPSPPPSPNSYYEKSKHVGVETINGFSGLTGTAAASALAATSIAGYLWGIGYGDRGYGETTPVLTAKTPGSIISNVEWGNLRTILSNMATWQVTSSSNLPTTAQIGVGRVVEAHNSSAPTLDAYSISSMLSSLDTNRLNINVANMTVTSSAATTTRATTWGSGNSGITCEFSVTFTDENAARYFFNTGGEIRIALSHPTTGTARNNSWNTVLNGLLVSFKANTSVRTSGSYGVAQAIGYYGLTTAYQTILDGTNTGVSPYTVNDFYVEAKANTITGLNGAKGSVLQFRVRLIDEQTNAFSDSVASGTVATLGHMRATGAPLTAKAAPTCAVVTAF